MVASSFNCIMEILKSIREEEVEFCNIKSSIITEPTDEQENILRLLEVEI